MFEPILEVVEEDQLRWLGHLCSFKEDRQRRNVFEVRPLKRRITGRPAKTVIGKQCTYEK